MVCTCQFPDELFSKEATARSLMILESDETLDESTTFSGFIDDRKWGGPASDSDAYVSADSLSWGPTSA